MEDISASVHLKALQTLRRHLGYLLRKEYIQIEDLAELRQHLHDRFLYEKTIFLPQACHDWMSLRMLNFPDLSFFNSELHCIIAQLHLCEEVLTKTKLISKTLSTFLLASVVLAQ